MHNYNNMPQCPASVKLSPALSRQAGAQMPSYQYPQMVPGAFALPQGAITPTGIPTAMPTGVPTGPAFPPPVTPTGIPTGPAYPPVTPGGVPTIAAEGEFVPQSVQSTMYLAGFLRTQIGRRVRVEFLIGTTGTTDRSGILIGVGASYILLREEGEDNIIVCDLYSIKFVTVYF